MSPQPSPRHATIPLRGPYDLREVAMMGFGHRDEQQYDGVMRLAFRVDHTLEHAVGIEIRQPEGEAGDSLELTVHDEPTAEEPADLDTVTAQVARIVSADHDGEHWARVCASDPVLTRLHAVAPGFRPALFHSAYEALVWSIISARRPRRQAIGLRAAIAERHGAAFDLAGQRVAALPGPTALQRIDSLPGVPVDRIPRLHAVAEAARSGEVEVDRLVAMDPEEAKAALQRLPGIGPFYAALVVVRALGHADVFSMEASHTRDAMRALYGFDHDPAEAELMALADHWRPFRTWAAVTLRAVGERVAPPAS